MTGCSGWGGTRTDQLVHRGMYAVADAGIEITQLMCWPRLNKKFAGRTRLRKRTMQAISVATGATMIAALPRLPPDTSGPMPAWLQRMPRLTPACVLEAPLLQTAGQSPEATSCQLADWAGGLG